MNSERTAMPQDKFSPIATTLAVAGSADLAAQIVSAYVSNNHLPQSEVGPFFVSVRDAIEAPTATVPERTEIRSVQKTQKEIKASITQDALISFIDGKGYSTLKRHLRTHGLDPHEYRQKFGLGSDYPMTSPGYSAKRSELAKKIDLGRPA